MPAFAAATGVTASMYLVHGDDKCNYQIVKMVGYGVVFLKGLFTASGIYSNSAGNNVVLEKVFKDNTAAYEGFGELLTIINMGIITAGTANSGLVLKKEKEGEPTISHIQFMRLLNLLRYKQEKWFRGLVKKVAVFNMNLAKLYQIY